MASDRAMTPPDLMIEQRVAALEAYVADLRCSFHIMTHSFVLASMPDSTQICMVCDRKLAEQAGPIPT